MMRRALTMLACGLAIALLAACGDGSGSSATPVSGGAFASTAAANGTPPPGGGATPAAAISDGTYAYDLANGGFTVELLLGVRSNALVVSQMNITNRTGSGVSAVPRLHYVDAQNHTFDAQTEGDWRRLYPADSLGLLDGQKAQIRVGFSQPFDPAAVQFCMDLGPQDLGCFTRRAPPTPIPTR